MLRKLEASLVRFVNWAGRNLEDERKKKMQEAIDPDPAWGVLYKEEVSMYHTKEEALKQLNFAQMDVPAILVHRKGNMWIPCYDY